MNRERQPPAGNAETVRKVNELGPWFHNLHLPDGTETAPGHFLGDFPSYKWDELQRVLPSTLEGWTVLDIGCNAGFYSFALARLGAAVTGIDSDGRYLDQARWAARQFGLEDRVSFEQRQVYELAHSTESYDLVLFLGVFYHLRYPLLGLDIAAARTRRLMAFQTLTMPGEAVVDTCCDRDFEEREAMLSPGWPKMAFIEHSFAGDPTNWWAPNHAAVEAMLRSAGLRIEARPGMEMYLCSKGPAAAQRRNDDLGAVSGLRGG